MYVLISHKATFYYFLFLGADPKSVLCVFFKQGLCSKGDKCKFSHDLAVERKGAKKNIYEDTREDGKLIILLLESHLMCLYIFKLV